jgi:hypothetical protein
MNWGGTLTRDKVGGRFDLLTFMKNTAAYFQESINYGKMHHLQFPERETKM